MKEPDNEENKINENVIAKVEEESEEKREVREEEKEDKQENNDKKKSKHMEEKNGKGKKVTLIVIIILLVVAIFVAGGYLVYKYYFNTTKEVIEEILEEEPEIVEEKAVQIYQGTDRPIAVMIDNHEDALPQGGLNDAYMVYEIIVEGGESRLMALFKGAEPEQIGPVRSARHYFLDYALENDAIYTHFGWSPQAQSDISSLGVNNINGLIESSVTFWRTKDKYSPHNVGTTIEKLKAVAEKRGYRLTSDNESVLHYVTDDVTLENGIAADTVTIPYSGNWNTVKYTYDPETMRYQRYSKGVEEKDWMTGEATTTKNIIITFARNYTLSDSENKGRQGLYNVGTLDGYYITNGKAIKITCEKTSRTSKTIYRDIDGNIIDVNDGNTFVQICPIDAKVTIEGNEPEVEEQMENNI